MKSYDLSQYMIRDGSTIIFPLTKQELEILMHDRINFEEYIKLPYIAKEFSNNTLKKIIDTVNMEDDYWFLKSGWVVVDTNVKAIIGFVNIIENEKIVKYDVVNLEVCPHASEDAVNLFNKFLKVNNFENYIFEEYNNENQ